MSIRVFQTVIEFRFRGRRVDIRNVTIAKQADQVRRETQDRDRAMADALPVLVWQSGRRQAPHLFQQGLAGVHWADSGAGIRQRLAGGSSSTGSCSAVSMLYFASFDRREPFELEYRLRHRSGEYRWIIDTGAPQFSFDGTFGVANNVVILEITDTGEGIPLDIDAFEPFMTTKKEGTGVGLVIVRQIVTAHGGKISYRSEPGEGTTFRLELPQRF